MALPAVTALPTVSFATLRPRFKQRQVETNNVYQNWQIRVHRALSWLKKSDELPDEQPEARFLFLWIALNCMYSRWDAVQNAPAPDTATRDQFCHRLAQLDGSLVTAIVRRYRPLIKTLLDDPYLSVVFWRDTDDPKNKGRATQDGNYIERNFKENKYDTVLCQAMQRLFVLRGQLVHGASTSGGRLNRKPLNRGLDLLKAVVPLAIHIVLEKGCGDDWPELCYPPVGK